MLDALGSGTRLGYCTNVHSGSTLRATLENLSAYAVRVRSMVAPSGVLGVGLWLSAEAAREARTKLDEIRASLESVGLCAFTFNGFPYFDFHESIVKHRVYEPDWSDPRRLAYTLDLVDILAGLMREGEHGSISTLPVGWPTSPCRPVDKDAAAHHLRAAAHHMARVHERTGKLIHLDLEPEPGCILQDSAGAVRFFEECLLRPSTADEPVARRHLRICHDTCHAAVVFESQREALDRYAGAGIQVGKVQISSAPRLSLGGLDAVDRAASVGELASFVENRYLHQTRTRSGVGPVREFDDLPQALASSSASDATEWRVHFHTPLFLGSIGRVGTTRDEILPAIETALAQGVKHFEVETYAWTVLPPELREPDLSRGIAAELRWLIDAWRARANDPRA